MNQILPDKMRKLKDRAWLDLLIKSVSTPCIEGVDFPGFPADEVQTRFVGSSNEKALREAYNFYTLVKKYAQKLGKPIRRKGPFNEGSRFLDFGSGWGRYLRFFWKDLDEENLFGCDIDQSIVDLCHRLNVPGQIDKIEPMGTLPYPDHYFDTIMAYSVFTHLPEKVHLHWMRELARVAQPGCVFCLTLEPRRFIDFIDNIPEDTDQDWYRRLSKHKPRVKEFRQAFDAGELVFMPTNAGVEDHYGDAAVPPAFIKKNWGPFFATREYIDNRSRFWQAVLVAQRLR